MGLALAMLCGASARAAGGEIVRSQYALSVLFADLYGDRFRCRIFERGRGFQWEAREGGKWCAVDITVVQAAELGARVYHATGANGEPYPAPDVGGSLATAEAVLGLAYHRMLAR